MQKHEILRGFGSSWFGKINVQSVQNSHIWLIGIVLLITVVGAICGLKDWIILVLLVIILILVAYYIYRDKYFMLNHPEYLRSETLHMQKMKMEMMGSQSKEISPELIASQPVTENPVHISLTDAKGGSK